MKLGIEDESMVIINSLSSSHISSSVIGTPNDTLVCPARNVTVYGPAE